METYFGPEFFKRNREKLRTLFAGTAPIVLTANGLLQRSGDTTFPFRQDSNFWYLTGVDDPDVVLVMGKDKEYLILPMRGQVQEIFDGSIESKKISKISGIQTVLDHKTGWNLLTSKLGRVRHVATLAAAPSYIEQSGMYTNPARRILISRLKKINPNIELLDLRTHLTHMRMIKQSEELTAIQSAVDISVKALMEVSKKLSKYTREYQIETNISNYFGRKGIRHAYQSIIASDEHACTLHYITNNDSLVGKSLVLIDAGAEIEYYAADITRTYAIKPPSKRAQAVYAAVIEVQEFAKSYLKPGVIAKDYEQQVEHFMGEKLRELGLIKSIDQKSVQRFYPHGTSHFLGLDVHDVGDYSRPLEPNMVLTVEPGIYIPKEGIGIRIEDDILITPTGNRVLSNKLPRTLL